MLLVGEFMVAFLLVLIPSRTAVNSDFFYSLLACFAIGPQVITHSVQQRFAELNIKIFMLNRGQQRLAEENIMAFSQKRAPQRFVEQSIMATIAFSWDRAPQRLVEQNIKAFSPNEIL